jgi:SHS2 domain-containing protein
VRIADQRLAAKAWGEAVEIARHQPAAEVKGATLSELEVARGADGRCSSRSRTRSPSG